MNDLGFIPSLADSIEEYKTLVNSIKNHRLPAAVTGLAGIHKNHFTAALSRTLGRKTSHRMKRKRCVSVTTSPRWA